MRLPALDSLHPPLAPRGLLNELVESHFLALLFGTSALVGLGLWLAWQLASLRSQGSHERSAPR